MITPILLSLLGITSCITDSLPTTSMTTPIISAHRGGRHIPEYPENAIATFVHTLNSVPDAWIECDVSMTADSVLFLLHDDRLDRTTTMLGKANQLSWSAIDTCHLKDDLGLITPYKLPLFTDVLLWAKDNEVTLTVDVKKGVPFERVIALIDSFELTAETILITYTPQVASQVYDLEPELRISATMRNEEELARHLALGIPPEQLIAFTGLNLSPPTYFDHLRRLGIPAILGTIGNLDQKAAAHGDALYCAFIAQGATILATDRPAEAWQALQQCGEEAARK